MKFCIKFCVFSFIIVLISGCATIPKEAVTLSEELTNMIKSAKESHLALVDEYISEKRNQIDTFMKERWIPDFMKEFISESNILKNLEEKTTVTEKQKELHLFEKAAAKQIYERRESLLNALEEIEKALKKPIIKHYNNMLMINQALTAHLRSAAEVTATRNELLKQINLKPEELIPLNKINDIVNNLIHYKGKIENISDIVNNVKRQIEKGGE